MEHKSIKGKEYLPPGYIMAPWVTIGSRGRFLDAVDNIVLRILSWVSRSWHQSYLVHMSNRNKVRLAGGFSVDKRLKDAYKNKVVNPKFYGNIRLSDFADGPKDSEDKNDKQILY